MTERELIQQYPPGRWKCPACGKDHTGPHYSVPGQLDYTKKPSEKGRILFNRRGMVGDELKTDTPIDKTKGNGLQFDGEGVHQPLYCPHCGWEDEIIVTIRLGELPDIVDQFFQEEDVDPKKSWRKILNQFLGWFKKREDGQ